jgi:hypothetical protein
MMFRKTVGFFVNTTLHYRQILRPLGKSGALHFCTFNNIFPFPSQCLFGHVFLETCRSRLCWTSSMLSLRNIEILDSFIRTTKWVYRTQTKGLTPLGGPRRSIS